MKKKRHLDKPKKVERLDEWPSAIPKPRPRKGSLKERGYKYEDKVAAHLNELDGRFDKAEVLHGQWISFFDKNGPGLAQPDFIVAPRRGPICVIEAKLTYRPEAEWKLRNLYGPLVKKLYPRRKQRLVCVTKNLTPECADLPRITTLEEAISQPHDYCVWKLRL